RTAKDHGFSDAQIGQLREIGETQARQLRHVLGIRPVYKTVDTCAGEFPARTPYHYSSYDQETEVAPSDRPKVLILGSGPNRIGQGIEFDYSCVHAVMALREAGYETVMVNCNPETVSTDYDTADRLYFEPLTFEDVLEVVHAEQESGTVAGVIVQPSYVLGGRGMEIVYDEQTLAGYIARATAVSPEHPVLVDRFLDDAVEIDVDALCDGHEVFIGGVMEHIEEAGIHSGDSSCTLPPVTLGRTVLANVRRSTEAIAHGVGVRGLLNVQYA